MNQTLFPDLLAEAVTSEKLPTIFNIFRNTSWPGWTYPYHIHPKHVEMNFVFSGHGQYTIDGITYNIKENDLILIMPGMIHSSRSDDEQPLDLMVLNFSLNLTDSSIHSVYPIASLGEHAAYFHAAFRELHVQRQKSFPDTSFWDQDTLSYMTSAALIMQALFLFHSAPMQKPFEYGFSYDVLLYIYENYNKSITLESLSRHFHISSSHISNSFSKTFGISPVNYLIDLRLVEARQRLVNTSDTVASIAADVGYDNVAYFNHLFKKRLGMTPFEYRVQVSPFIQ